MERLANRVAPGLGLPRSLAGLLRLPEGETRKVSLEVLLRRRTIAPGGWIAERFAVRQGDSMSRLTGPGRVGPDHGERA